jgi:uncharacterized protein YuzB (UPF0349 family)
MRPGVEGCWSVLCSGDDKILEQLCTRGDAVYRIE